MVQVTAILCFKAHSTFIVWVYRSAGHVHGVISSMTIAQVSRKVMLADVVQRHGVDHRGLIARQAKPSAREQAAEKGHRTPPPPTRELAITEPIDGAMIIKGNQAAGA